MNMTGRQTKRTIDCDVLVAGSGAGGLTTAIVAAKHGLKVIVVEKEDVYGGTTALSGGYLWIPDNHLAKAAGVADSKDLARAYIRHEAGEHFDSALVEAFLEAGPKMLRFMYENTCVR